MTFWNGISVSYIGPIKTNRVGVASLSDEVSGSEVDGVAASSDVDSSSSESLSEGTAYDERGRVLLIEASCYV